MSHFLKRKFLLFFAKKFSFFYLKSIKELSSKKPVFLSLQSLSFTRKFTKLSPFIYQAFSFHLPSFLFSPKNSYISISLREFCSHLPSFLLSIMLKLLSIMLNVGIACISMDLWVGKNQNFFSLLNFLVFKKPLFMIIKKTLTH